MEEEIMKRIYLGETIVNDMSRRTFTIDRIPPKSCYKDRNRSDIVVSDTFKSPNEQISEKLYASARCFFGKKNQ